MLAQSPGRREIALSHHIEGERLTLYDRGSEISTLEHPTVARMAEALLLAKGRERNSFNCFGAIELVIGRAAGLAPVLEMPEIGERKGFGEAFRTCEPPSIVQVCGSYEIPCEISGSTISRRGPIHAALVVGRDEENEDLVLFEKDSWSGPLGFVRLSDVVTRYFNRSGAGAEYVKYASLGDLESARG